MLYLYAFEKYIMSYDFIIGINLFLYEFWFFSLGDFSDGMKSLHRP